MGRIGKNPMLCLCPGTIFNSRLDLWCCYWQESSSLSACQTPCKIPAPKYFSGKLSKRKDDVMSEHFRLPFSLKISVLWKIFKQLVQVGSVNFVSLRSIVCCLLPVKDYWCSADMSDKKQREKTRRGFSFLLLL